MGDDTMAHIEIKTKGLFGEVIVDGQKVNGVRRVSFDLCVDNKAPVLKLELVATDMVIDSRGVLPALPDIFKPFYKKIEPTEE